jgi:hypothetical protein
MSRIDEYVAAAPTPDSSWRAIVLFGRNVASYKFALGEALLGLTTSGHEKVRLEELAVPYAQAICRHLRGVDKQGTSGSSRFLQACRQYNQGALSHDELISSTVRWGFENVLDAFHVVNQADVPHRFFVDERATDRAIRLTDAWHQIVGHKVSGWLPSEVEARWRLVETAWATDLPVSLIEVDTGASRVALWTTTNGRRRVQVTAARDALVGYQKGKCFYCYRSTGVDEDDARSADVDHFLPAALMSRGVPLNLDGVWNLVVACRGCNRGAGGKSMRIPTIRYLERLWKRNEYYIASHHPLRETILEQTGHHAHQRRSYLWNAYREAEGLLVHSWEPTLLEEDIL